jgi:acetyl/propionyl-CoA carboxylase alpha subunit
MVAKLASWGRNRAEAIQRMKVALEEIEISGVPTTIPLHHILMSDNRFIQGDFHTNYLNEMLPSMNSYVARLEEFAVVAAAIGKTANPTRFPNQQTMSQGARWRAYARTTLMTHQR